MIYQHVQLFNVDQIEETGSSIRLHRIPQTVQRQLGYQDHSRGRLIAQYTTGCEIRFVTNGPIAAVTLEAIHESGEVLIYQGDYLYQRRYLPHGKPTRLMLEDHTREHQIPDDILHSGRFAPHVWRIIICHDFICALHAIDDFGYAMRSPHRGETPATQWMAYGSSITHGAGAQLHTNAYIMSAARHLGIDVLNKGMGGSCLIESAMADYLATTEWDMATLELGVNMRNLFTPEEFRNRSHYLMRRIREEKPRHPVALITIFPNFATYTPHNTLAKEREAAYNTIIRELYEDYRHDGVTHLIEGADILQQFGWLTGDLIHPSEYGHFRMGQALAEHLHPLLL